MKSKQAIVAICILICAVFLIWKSPNEDKASSVPEPMGNAYELPTAVQEDAPLAAILEDSPGPSPEPSLGDRVELTPSIQPDSNSTPAELTVNDPFEITAVSSSAFRSVPDTTVYIFASAELTKKEMQRVYDGGDGEKIAFTRDRGEKHQTNESGKLTIQMPKETIWIYMEKNGLAGFDDYFGGSETRPLTVTLYSKGSVQVTVVNFEGIPLPHFPFNLLSIRGKNDSVFPKESFVTDENGTRLIEGLGPLQARISKGYRFSFAPDIPLQPSHFRSQTWPELTEEILHGGEIKIQVPGTASIEISVLDIDGKSYTGAATVILSAKQDEAGYAWLPEDKQLVSNGVAKFPFVGIGFRLEAMLWRQGEPNRILIEFDGPSKPDTLVTAEIRVTPQPVFTGILYGPEGEILPRQRFKLSHMAGNSNHYMQEGASGVDGKFRSKFRKDPRLHQDQPQSIVINAELNGVGKCRAEVALPEGFDGKSFDVGSVHLQQLNVLLSGRVLSQKDRPIEYAEVKLVSVEILGEFARKFTILASARTDSAGRFFLTGESIPGQTNRVEIEAKGFSPHKSEVIPGSEDALFHLEPASRFVGSIRISEQMDFSDLQITFDGTLLKTGNGLLPTPDPLIASFNLPGDPDREQPYSFKVRTKFHETVFEMNPIIFPNSGELRPAELQPLDLREQMRKIQIRVQDPAGNPVSTQIILSHENPWSSFKATHGEATLVLGSPAQIRAHAIGFTDEFRTDVWTDQTIVMHPADCAFVKIPTSLLHIPNTTPSIYSSSPTMESKLGCGPINQDGVGALYLPRAGSYNVGLKMTWVKNGQGGTRTFPTQPFADLRDGETISLNVDIEEIQRWTLEMESQ